MVRQMKVSGVTMDPQSNTPVVMLQDPESDTALPIWIGHLEATAIATVLEQVEFPRPMTHDLIKNIMGHLEVGVDRVEVCDLRDNTFYAWIYLVANGKETRIDSRPSDALAIALRMQAPIYVHERVFEKSRVVQTGAAAGEEQDDQARQWAEILEKLSPEDFGPYEI
jgi:hypothetical protein